MMSWITVAQGQGGIASPQAVVPRAAEGLRASALLRQQLQAYPRRARTRALPTLASRFVSIGTTSKSNLRPI